MRLVYVAELEKGMITAKPIFNERSQCLVNKDVELSDKLIERIKALDYDRLWIKDEYDFVTDSLSEELKLKAVRSIKSVFTGYTSKKVALDTKKIDVLKEVIESVVDEIMDSRQCVIQLSNLKNYSNSMYEHAVDVARVAVLIGANMDMKKEQLIHLCEASMLHDIGKIQISTGILDKKTEYTSDELKELQKHVAYGYKIIKETGRFTAPVYVAILQHHESYNGSGYPEATIGEKVNIYARIIKIADVYSNMRTGTANIRAFSQSEVLEYFYADGSREFDPKILQVFLSKVPVYEVGQIVKLSTGQKAFIAQNNESALSRPIVRVLFENKTLGEEIDLSTNLNITIM